MLSIAEIGAELEELEALRMASRVTERASLDWPELRRAVLAYGGIGPSRDWDNSSYPADLYRAGGSSPDLVAAEAVHPAPWGDTGDDSAMVEYLRRSYAAWRRTLPVCGHEHYSDDAASACAVNLARVPKVVKVSASAPIRARKPGERSFSELVAELKRKHGAEVDLSGLRAEYVSAYETGERIEVERDGRTYRGTIGATRGPRPRFVLLLSLDL